MKFSLSSLGLFEFVVLANLISEPTPATSIVIKPPDADCWNTTQGIIFAEIEPVYNVQLYNTERIYVICPGTYVIGIIDFNSQAPFPVGGDFPILVVNPNFHLKCIIPGSCIFTGGRQQFSSAIDNRLVSLFLGFLGLPPIPEGYFVGTSNLLVEGMTFANSVGSEQNTRVALLGAGTNRTFSKCLWTTIKSPEFDPVSHDQRPGSALSLGQYPGQDNSTLTSLRVVDSVFENNVFSRSIFTSFLQVPYPPPLPKAPSEATFENTVFKNNVILTNNEMRRPAYSSASFFELSFGSLTLKNCQVLDNIQDIAPAYITLLAEGILNIDTTTIFKNNSILEDISPECGNAIFFPRNDSLSAFDDDGNILGLGGSISTAECIELEVTPAPTKAPTSIPTKGKRKRNRRGMGMMSKVGKK